VNQDIARFVRRTVTAWVAVFALGLSATAFGYPFMIRRDYTACSMCHADPSGGSLLTLYGRATGELLLRSQYGAAEDRDPGKIGNFMFGAFDLPENVLMSASARGMYMSSGPVGADSTSRIFPMQLDAVAQVTFWRIRGNGSIGYGQSSRTEPITLAHFDPNAQPGPQLVSRHNWLGIDLGEDKEWLLRAGRMNLPFGLRSIEHTQWVRTETRTDTNIAQQDGISLAYSIPGLRGEVMAIAGNLVLKPADYRELGYSAFLEYAPSPQIAIGASSLITHANLDLATGAPMWRHAHGLFARYSPHRMLVLSTEQDLTLFSQPSTVNLWGLASLLVVDFEPYQGLHLLATGEARSRGLGYWDTSVAAWGSLAWFFAPHADVRADLIWNQVANTMAGPSTGSSQGLSFLVQLHFFL
jgi:hypothetical protein